MREKKARDTKILIMKENASMAFKLEKNLYTEFV